MSVFHPSGDSLASLSSVEPEPPRGAQLLRLLRSRWWLVVLVLLPTVGLAFLRVSAEAPVYESTSTFVVRPSQEDAEGMVRAMDTLLRGVEINTTYANVVGSQLIEDRALARLDLSDDQREGLDARGNIVTGTSIVEIRATAQDPEVAQRYGEAIAEETLQYIGSLGNAFELAPLDPPTLPRSPTGPRVTLTVALSAILGGLLGLGLVMASGSAFPLGTVRPFDIVDRTTGARTGDYLLARFREELSRVGRAEGVFTLAIVEPVRRHDGLRGWVSSLFADTELTRTVEMLRRPLRDEDVVAYLGGRRFGLLATARTDGELLIELRNSGLGDLLEVTAVTYGSEDADLRGSVPDVESLLQLVRLRLMSEGPRGASAGNGAGPQPVTHGRPPSVSR